MNNKNRKQVAPQELTEELTEEQQTRDSKRKLLGLSAVALTSPFWIKPVINSVILPAHAQTSMCMTDTTVGGPLAGNPSGVMNCADACAAEAADQNAQLCLVTETVVSGSTECACELDLP